jgi:hypothetical protein
MKGSTARNPGCTSNLCPTNPGGFAFSNPADAGTAIPPSLSQVIRGKGRRQGFFYHRLSIRRGSKKEARATVMGA